jgi:CRP-like cAMP-binding protein
MLLKVVVQPNETLFETGDDSSSGIFIVLEGAIGVYMHDGEKLMHTNTLRPGESVGDVDILDGMQTHRQLHACRLCFQRLYNPSHISCMVMLFKALLWHAQHECACQCLSLHRLFFIAV